MRSAMRKRLFSLTFVFICICVLMPASGFGQNGKGVISGTVKDSGGAVLQGAKVDLQPQGRPISSDQLGEFTISEVDPGTYTVNVSYVGFASFTSTVTVA